MALDPATYLTLWPQIQTAFAHQGLTITIAQAEAIVLELAPIFRPAAPQPAPPAEPPPVVPAAPSFVNLNVLCGVPGARVTISVDYGNGTERIADGSGFANFGVPVNTTQLVSITAPGYLELVRTPPIRDVDYTLTVTLTIDPNAVRFDHPWTGAVEGQLRRVLESGLAGPDGANGQAVVDRLNAMGGIYAGGEFQAHHDGPAGYPTYGYPWFYVSYVPLNDGSGRGFYQIVEFGHPPAENVEAS